MRSGVGNTGARGGGMSRTGVGRGLREWRHLGRQGGKRFRHMRVPAPARARSAGARARGPGCCRPRRRGAPTLRPGPHPRDPPSRVSFRCCRQWSLWLLAFVVWLSTTLSYFVLPRESAAALIIIKVHFSRAGRHSDGGDELHRVRGPGEGARGMARARVRGWDRGRVSVAPAVSSVQGDT